MVMQQNQQLQTQEIQRAGLENQQITLNLQDQQTLRDLAPKYIQKDATGKVTGFDYDGFTSEAGARGVSPASLNQLATLRKTAADTTLAQSTAQKNYTETQQKLLDQAFQHLEGIRGETDPQKPEQLYQS